MSDLVAVCFKGHDTAGKVLGDLEKMQKEYIVDMEDACWVSRDADGKLKLHQTMHLAGVGAMSGASWGGLWGLLIGLLFLNPLAGFAIGAAAGAGRAMRQPCRKQRTTVTDDRREAGCVNIRPLLSMRPMPVSGSLLIRRP